MRWLWKLRLFKESKSCYTEPFQGQLKKEKEQIEMGRNVIIIWEWPLLRYMRAGVVLWQFSFFAMERLEEEEGEEEEEGKEEGEEEEQSREGR